MVRILQGVSPSIWDHNGDILLLGLLGGLLGGVAGYRLRASYFGRGLCAALSLTEACGGMRWSVVIYIPPPPNWHSR